MRYATWLMLAAALPLLTGAALAETGYTLRVTDLKATPFLDAETLARRLEKAEVEIVLRQGPWMQVKTKDKQLVKGLQAVSEPEEIEIGGGVTETLLGARPMENDIELQRYVNVVGLWVARQSERPNLPWHFAVNDSDYINAFATPGGNIIITKGMIRVLHNESELAGVIGHNYVKLLFKTHPAPSARLEKLGIAMSTSFDSITGGPQSNERFLSVTERIRVTAAK